MRMPQRYVQESLRAVYDDHVVCEGIYRLQNMGAHFFVYLPLYLIVSIALESLLIGREGLLHLVFVSFLRSLYKDGLARFVMVMY